MSVARRAVFNTRYLVQNSAQNLTTRVSSDSARVPAARVAALRFNSSSAAQMSAA